MLLLERRHGRLARLEGKNRLLELSYGPLQLLLQLPVSAAEPSHLLGERLATGAEVRLDGTTGFQALAVFADSLLTSPCHLGQRLIPADLELPPVLVLQLAYLPAKGDQLGRRLGLGLVEPRLGPGSRGLDLGKLAAQLGKVPLEASDLAVALADEREVEVKVLLGLSKPGLKPERLVLPGREGTLQFADAGLQRHHTLLVQVVQLTLLGL